MAKKLSININVQNLPPAAKAAIVFAPALIVVISSFLLFYRPRAAEIKRLKADITAQDKEIAKNEAKLAKLPEVKRRYDELEMNLKILSAQLPEEKEVSDLLKQVSDYGVQSGLTITLWKPQAKRVHSTKIVYEIPVNVTMTGSYHSLGQFYSRLTGMNRIVNIQNIKLDGAPTKDDVGRLKISFIAQTFSAIPKDERGAAGGK